MITVEEAEKIHSILISKFGGGTGIKIKTCSNQPLTARLQLSTKENFILTH